MTKKHESFPAWYYGPKGESEIFHSENDVPKGWLDHPSKHKKAPAVEVVDRQVERQTVDDKSGLGQSTGGQVLLGEGGAPGSDTGDLDAHGHAWDPALHAATKSKTKDALWRMKVGVARPEPAPGYPKPPSKPPLDL